MTYERLDLPWQVCGESKRLVDLVVDPWDYLASNGRLRINAHYYIAKALIPPMERLLRDCLGVFPLPVSPLLEW